MKRVISLAELLTFKNVYREDANWAGLLTDFQRSPADWHTVQQLAAELHRDQFFREPVYVGYPEPDDHSEQWVFDGTHRACAYLLVGAPKVEVEFEEEGDGEWRESEASVQTVIRPLGDYAPAVEGGSAAGITGLWQALLSMRVDSDVWLTSDMSTTGQDPVEVTVFWDSGALDISAALITECAKSQLAHFGFDTSRLELVTSRVASADN